MKKITRITAATLALTLLFAFAGCAPSKIKPKEVTAVDLLENLTANAVEGIETDEKFVSAMNDFALKLFRETYKYDGSGENFMLSPLSVTLALAMVANGAKGETRAEFEKVLTGGNFSVSDLNRYLLTYAKNLYTADDCKLETANSVWFRNLEDFEVLKSFLQNVIDYYDASVYAEPFDETTLENINNWVYNHTDGMIDKILDDISPADMMFLINAVVFDAKWQNEYEKKDIASGKFTREDGKKISVDMMTSTEHTYYEDDLAVGFAKNYIGGKYSFVALLPNEGVTLADYIAELDGARIEKLLNNPLPSTKVVARTPKFSFDYSTHLEEVLAALGMPTAFTGAADFSGITDPSVYPLAISEVVHKTFIELSEKGTKAAAVTEIGMKATSAYVENVKYVTLDRPFVFMILDNESKTPIFIGSLSDIK